jgi:hypothetical protein
VRQRGVVTRAAADTSHPAVRALAEIAALRGSLDRLETALVVRAREDGCWWGEIGAALGLTKQGAHRRHAAHDPVTERRRRREARRAAELGEQLAASLRDLPARRGGSGPPAP